jgi:hypothetical protein
VSLTKKLTKDAVAARVEQIAASSGDDERAHGMEDSLYSDVLQQIADGTLRGAAARDVAAEALKAADLEFARWCA